MPRPKQRYCGKDHKRRFTELEAKLALLRNQRKDRGEKRAYKCNICGDWHLTSQDPDQGRVFEGRSRDTYSAQ